MQFYSKTPKEGWNNFTKLGKENMRIKAQKLEIDKTNPILKFPLQFNNYFMKIRLDKCNTKKCHSLK